MTKNPVALARQKARSEQRRAEVLAAASTCFRREGVHAASVNRIAAEAGMSVGHLYKHFDSKAEIVAALCDERLSEFIAYTPKLQADEGRDLDALVAASLRDFDVLIDVERASFIMEMLLEAGRNESIAGIVLSADERLRRNQEQLLEPFLKELPVSDRQVRVEMVLLLLQGLAARIASNPKVNVVHLKAGFEIILRALLQT